MSGTDIIAAILLIGILIAVIVYLLYWLYRRASKEVAFVRTGFGGEKVVLNGGALVLPIIHNITRVGMTTIRLEVKIAGDRSLITKNRMRVEVAAEFYVRVRPDKDSVSIAAQALGHRTLQPEQLKELVQGRFIDALAEIAAQMTMDEMQEKRGQYIKSVRSIVEDALQRTGLELEAASLTALDQTPIEKFNPSNAFDAEGLTQLTEQIERRKKKRNDIEQETTVQIRAKNLEAERESLEISKQSEYARLEQEREVSKRKAAEKAEVAKDRAEREREARLVEIEAQEAVEREQIQKEKAIEAERSLRETTLTEEIEQRRKHRNDVERDTDIAIRLKDQEAEVKTLEIERDIEFSRLQQQQEVQTKRAQQQAEVARQRAAGDREAELAQIQALEAVETSRIGQEQAVESARIKHNEAIEKLEVNRKKSLQIEEQDRAIAITKKEKEKAAAQTELEEARASVAEAEERVATTREREAAERRKLIELIEAARAVEAEAIQLTTIAEAQTRAAEQNAAAEKFATAASKLRYEVDAAGRQQMHEADNALSDESRFHSLRMKLVDHLDSIIRESVKPMEQIKDIKILQVDGLPGLSGLHPSSGGTGGDSGEGGGSDMDGPSGNRGGGTLADNIVSSALRYRAQAPFVDTLLGEIGMSPGEITNIGNLLDDKGNLPSGKTK